MSLPDNTMPFKIAIELTESKINFILNEWIDNKISLKAIQQSVAKIEPNVISKETPIGISLTAERKFSSPPGLTPLSVLAGKKVTVRTKRDAHGRFKSKSKSKK